MRRASDIICLEHGLSVIENSKPSRGHYGTWLGEDRPPSFQEKLRQAIDAVLAQQPKDFDAFLSAMGTLGYEVKLGRGISYAKNQLLHMDGDNALFIIGTYSENYEIKTRLGYEIGWCGQNALLARALINNGIKENLREDIEIGINVLDTWTKKGRYKNGLVDCYFQKEKLSSQKFDTCNLAWASWQILCAYEDIKEIGIEKPDWYDYAIGVCDFFVINYSKEFGFGKTWSSMGEIIDCSGTIGVFLTIALLKAYEITKEEKYCTIAKKALGFYYNRDLKNFVCTAGALDTSCVDKETCWPFLNSAITLYKITNNEEILEIALNAAYYLLSWTYLYDVPYDYDCDFNAMGYRTKGGTSVSAQHHHLDPWGALICGDFFDLYEITKDEKWKNISKLMWDNCIMCIAGKDYSYKGTNYPYGAQGEAYFHTNWIFAKDYPHKKGGINTWFVAWPSAFRLHTIMKKDKKEMKGDKNG